MESLTITGEFLVVIIVNVLCGGVYLGSLVGAIKFIEKQIERLEEKQDRHNDIVSKVYGLEAASRAGHRRLDEQAEDIKLIQETLLRKK